MWVNINAKVVQQNGLCKLKFGDNFSFFFKSEDIRILVDESNTYLQVKESSLEEKKISFLSKGKNKSSSKNVYSIKEWEIFNGRRQR